MTENPQTAALNRFRAMRAESMEESVLGAIASLVSEGEALSFYKVAEYAQIARSTLYRKDNLRKLVEDARDRSRTDGRHVRRYDELLQENEKLKEEIRALRREMRLMRGDRASGRGHGSLSRFSYCAVSLAA